MVGFVQTMIAWLIGFTGLCLTLYLGGTRFGVSEQELLGMAVWAFFSGTLALITVIEAQHVELLRKTLVRGPLMTWLVLSAIYFALLLGGIPRLRDPEFFATLVLPLLGVNGFSALVFGPYQDWRVRNRQRGARLSHQPSPPSSAPGSGE